MKIRTTEPNGLLMYNGGNQEQSKVADTSDRRSFSFYSDGITDHSLFVPYFTPINMAGGVLRLKLGKFYYCSPSEHELFEKNFISVRAVSYTHLTLPTKRIV